MSGVAGKVCGEGSCPNLCRVGVVGQSLGGLGTRSGIAPPRPCVVGDVAATGVDGGAGSAPGSGTLNCQLQTDNNN